MQPDFIGNITTHGKMYPDCNTLTPSDFNNVSLFFMSQPSSHNHDEKKRSHRDAIKNSADQDPEGY
jgi:hypothetical protein